VKLIILESPFAGRGETLKARELDHQLNVQYAKAAMKHSLSLGESPMVSHLLYTQVLDDTIPSERALGISAGLAWRVRADASVVYLDRGMSFGMIQGVLAAKEAGIPRIYRAEMREGFEEVYVNEDQLLGLTC
jgi:hypothetical protein